MYKKFLSSAGLAGNEKVCYTGYKIRRKREKIRYDQHLA